MANPGDWLWRDQQPIDEGFGPLLQEAKTCRNGRQNTYILLLDWFMWYHDEKVGRSQVSR